MSPAFREHDPGAGHPESPLRYDAVAAAVAASGLEVVEPRPASPEALERIHDPRLLELIRRLCDSGGGALDPDTVVGPTSFDAARLASGAAVAAVSALLDGEIESAFCAGRPPGHHAEPARAMGFCLVNHIAVAAAHARWRGVERVAILDWDAHHGNGTQAAFWDDPSVLYVSLHQFPHYPGTGTPIERGEGAAEGTTINLPLPAGTTEELYLATFRAMALPPIQAFDPGLLLVSAGFDAHRDDPLCSLGLSAAAFRTMTEELAGIGAGQIYVLEGGYDLDALEQSVAAMLVAAR
jgi:acetoin utilization deacetylase AcuC-like enzyme